MSAGTALLLGLLFVAVVVWLGRDERNTWESVLPGVAVAVLLIALALSPWWQR